MTALTRRRTAASMAALTGLTHLVLVPEYLEEKTYIGLLFLGAPAVCGAAFVVLAAIGLRGAQAAPTPAA